MYCNFKCAKVELYYYNVASMADCFFTFSLAYCIDPGTPKYGNRKVSSVDGGFADGTVVYFYCNAQYKLIGGKKIICTKGKWNGKKPICQSQGNMLHV